MTTNGLPEMVTKVNGNHDEEVKREELIKAVREDKLVGRGSGSIVDSWSDDDLWLEIGRATTSRAARYMAHRAHKTEIRDILMASTPEALATAKLEKNGEIHKNGELMNK